jgi:hypothetical protein
VLWHGIQLFTEVINGVLELVMLMSTNRLTFDSHQNGIQQNPEYFPFKLQGARMG